MKTILGSAILCCFGMFACKTSQFKRQTDEGTAPVIEIPDSAPRPATVQTKPAEPGSTEVSSASVEAATSTLQLNQTCERPVQLLNSIVKLNFPATTKFCSFGQAPNLTPLNNFVQARELSAGMLKLPDNSEICSITIESPADTMLKYDDFIVLTLDDFVVFASNKLLVAKLAQVNSFYKWDFAKVVGSPIDDFMGAPYCIGASDRCIFPGTDKVGPVLLKLNFSEISGITKTLQGKTAVPINIVATGDDNVEKDCFHTALNLTISMSYIKKPKP
jgi:hypothetical protein